MHFAFHCLEMTQAFAKWLTARFLFVVYFLITVSPLLLLRHFTNDTDKFPPSLDAVCGLYGLGALFGSWWLSKNTAQHLIDEHLAFVDAVKQTWLDTRLRLAFFPVIGPLFIPDEDKTKYDDDDEIRNFRSPTEE